MSRKVLALLLLMAAAAVYLAGNARTQLFDRDEPRYAQCSRQMLQSGDWVVPRLYDKIRAAKPPGIYWCQATAMALLGDNAFAARMPSVLASVLTSLLLTFALWRQVGARQTLWTVFVFATSVLTIISAKICLTDSVLLLWTTIALLCVYRFWRGQAGWPAALTLAVAIGCGGMTKGPFILGVLAATLCILLLLSWFDRWRGIPLAQSDTAAQTDYHGPIKIVAMFVVGLVILLAIVLPWLYLVHQRSPEFLHASTADAMAHMEKGTEGHTGKPGYHLLLIWFTFLPWSLLLPLAIGSGIRNRRVPEVRFALAVVIGTWIFVEILQTKLPHYILSAFPALAFLTADAIIRCLDGEYSDLRSSLFRFGSLVWAIAILGLTSAPWWWLAVRFHDFPYAALVPLSLFGILYAATVVILFWKQRQAAALVSMGTGSFVLTVLLFVVYFPQSRPLRLPIRVAEVLKQNDVVHPGQVMMLDYKEPSLAFYQGGTIREATHSLKVIENLETAPPWMVVSRPIWDQTPPDIRARLEIIGPPLDGLNYSDALRPAEVLVVRKR
jgi:4-amino-4-deoxy-L-arabinose transferase-like glycosyltransferase